MAEFLIDVIVNPSGATSGARRVRRELDGVENAADRVRASLVRAFAAIGTTAFLANAIRATTQFQTAIAEVSTLIDAAVFDINELEQAALDQASAFGQDPQRQARALYQIISSGAQDAAEATTILNAANRLAIGGVTDVAIAADGLSSILNAYGLAAQDAADVSDILFVAVREGRTTVQELSTTLGRVAPIAASAGVGFDELAASVAALTTGGISTAEAVTGVRAILAAIIRPTSEAAQFAESLGIEFNAAALEARGLTGVLDDVIQATGGSTDALAQLFTGVEALVPALALSGAAGENLDEILLQLEDRAGSTDAAFGQLEETFGFQLNRLIRAAEASITALLIPALEAITPAIRFAADNIGILIDAIGTLAIILSARLALTAIPLAVAALATLTAAAAANPFGAIVIGITLTISALSAFADEIVVTQGGLATLADVASATFEAILALADQVAAGFEQVFGGVLGALEGVFTGIELSFEGILRFAAQTFDALVGLAVGAGFAIVEAFRSVPAGIEAILVRGFNAISRQFTGFINNIIDGLNVIPGVAIDTFEAFTLEASSTFREIGGNVNTAFAAGFNASTSAEDALDGILTRAEQIAAERQEAAAAAAAAVSLPGAAVDLDTGNLQVPGIGGAGTGGSAAVDETNEALERQRDLLRDITGDQAGLALRQQDIQALFDTGQISAEQFAAAMRTLNAELTALDNTFAGGLANGFDRIIARTNELGAQVSDFVVGAFDSATQAVVDFARTGEFSVRQFFQDFFAQLLQLATNQLFAQLLGTIGGGAGGAGGAGLIAGLGGLLGFQNGGSFMVGGSGGADSQLVAFRATPNERVNIETPGQQRAREEGAGQSQPPPVNLNITNVTDPQAVVDAINTDAGTRQILNVIERNPQAIQRLLNR